MDSEQMPKCACHLITKNIYSPTRCPGVQTYRQFIFFKSFFWKTDFCPNREKRKWKSIPATANYSVVAYGFICFCCLQSALLCGKGWRELRTKPKIFGENLSNGLKFSRRIVCSHFHQNCLLINFLIFRLFINFLFEIIRK